MLWLLNAIPYTVFNLIPKLTHFGISKAIDYRLVVSLGPLFVTSHSSGHNGSCIAASHTGLFDVKHCWCMWRMA